MDNPRSMAMATVNRRGMRIADLEVGLISRISRVLSIIREGESYICI